MPDARDLGVLNGNDRLLTAEERKLLGELLALQQEHLFRDWPDPGSHDEDKKRLVEQLYHLDTNYPGGLKAYIENAKRLLEDSRAGKNSFEGYTPSVPEGEKLDYGSKQFREFERQGVRAAQHAAFVLVAGGLGERLGYSGIKIALPSDCARGACFLQVYIESILALQAKAPHGTQLPLAIMTSGDTHDRTEKLLRDHAHFGMAPDQITLLKQEKVACLADNEARLATANDNRWAVQTKPHGHGDVHSLLHTSGLLGRWRAAGTRWVAFFQDTNALVFRALPAALGVSAARDLDMNSLAVPRKAKEAIGGIARLTKAGNGGGGLTINVEYNLLEPLLKASGHPEGDINDASGFSPFPGNINQLVLKASSYAEALKRTGGVVAEFVNPKYADAGKSKFKSPTRLECMMQDYPHALPPSAAVGFTVINQVWAAYSPVKNAPADARAKVTAGAPSHSATTGELDIYAANCRALQGLGAAVAPPTPRTFNGLDVELWPRISWAPAFALTFDDLEAKVDAPGMRIGPNAVLVVNGGGVEFRGTTCLDGTLVVDATPGARVRLENICVPVGGWKWQALKPDKPATEEQLIRGFLVCKHSGALHLEFAEPGQYTYPEAASAPGLANNAVPAKGLPVGAHAASR